MSLELAVETGMPYFDLYEFWKGHYKENAPNYGHGS